MTENQEKKNSNISKHIKLNIKNKIKAIHKMNYKP